MKNEKLKIKNDKSVAQQETQKFYPLPATRYPLTQGVLQ